MKEVYELEEKNKFIISNKIKIILISLALVAFLAIFSINLNLTGRTASVVSAGTESSVTVSIFPEKPKVLEKMDIEMKVTSEKERGFFLELMIVQNGKTNKYSNYTFSLDAGDSNAFVLTYTPIGIEKENIVVNLYSSDRKILYDSKIMEFKAESDIGPFDIEIVPLTNFVQRGEELPFVVRMNNFGLKGTDVNLTVIIDCLNAPDIEQSSFIYLNTSEKLEKDFISPTCNETGQHRITASVFIYGVEFVSSKSQYFETDNLSHLDFSVPDLITVAENSSYMLNLKYTNNNKETLIDIEPIVFGIPSSWFNVSPLIIPEIKSGDFAVAIITFNVPKNSVGSYPLLIGASGDSLFSKRSIELRVTGMAENVKLAEISNLKNIVIILSAISIIGVLVFFVVRRWKRTYLTNTYFNSFKEE